MLIHITNTIKKTSSLIKNNKLLFAILIGIEFLYIVSLLFVQINYQLKIAENSREILSYYNELNLNSNLIADSESQNILGNEPLLMYRKFKELVNYIAILVSLTISIIIFFSTLNWGISEITLNKSKPKNFIMHIGKLAIINIVYTCIFAVLIFLSFQRFYLELILKNGLFFLPIIFLALVILYFMYISLSLSNQRSAEIIKNTFLIGFKKAHYMLIIYFLNLVFISGSFLFLLYLQNKMFILFLFQALIFLSVLIICRFFLIVSVRDLTRELAIKK